MAPRADLSHLNSHYFTNDDVKNMPQLYSLKTITHDLAFHYYFKVREHDKTIFKMYPLQLCQ